MTQPALTAISPIDGRYHHITQSFQPLFSEFDLIKHRLIIEIRWFEMLAAEKAFKALPALSAATKRFLQSLIDNFDEYEAEKVKKIEKTTNHDVKAIEYYLKEKFSAHKTLKKQSELLHFACTSEDINNLAYGLMIQSALSNLLSPALKKTLTQLRQLASKYSNIPMLARTHGQPATPTTLGKEFINFHYRLKRQLKQLTETEILGKMNGAVGNYNAHIIAYPNIDWPKLSKRFVQKLGLTFNPYTTQIEPHDYIAELSHHLIRINTIFTDLSRDIWHYISLSYFSLKKKENEVGSSTMPHKVNPIDFENCEGNCGLANALFHFFAEKLPISRLQRDLSDSTVMRNIGTAFAYEMIALTSLQKGLNKLEPDRATIHSDLNQHWEILAEAAQTIMRKYHIPHPYETLKKLTRGKALNQKSWLHLVEKLNLPKNEKTRLRKLTPATYVGLSKELSK